MSIYFSIPKAWNIGGRINNADTYLLCARAFIPSRAWLKSPRAPGSKHYYMAPCLGFSSPMGIWGPTWRQIGYQSQGWYKDRLWKSIGRPSYIGLAYLFLRHSARPFIRTGFCSKSITCSWICSHRSRQRAIKRSMWHPIFYRWVPSTSTRDHHTYACLNTESLHKHHWIFMQIPTVFHYFILYRSFSEFYIWIAEPSFRCN